MIHVAMDGFGMGAEPSESGELGTTAGRTMEGKTEGLKCSNCGGKLIFDVSSQRLRCGYCGNSYKIESAGIKKPGIEIESFEIGSKPFVAAAAPEAAPKKGITWEVYETTKNRLEGIVAYSCPSCHGQILAERSTAVEKCPFCGDKKLLENSTDLSYSPDKMIPFRFELNEAKSILLKYYRSKPFLPSVFKRKSVINGLKGIYVPFWLYDCEADAILKYKAYNQKVWTKSGFKFTQSDVHHMYKGGVASFNKIPADGSTLFNDIFMEALEPFDYSELVDYDPLYFTGYMAYRCDCREPDCKPHIEYRIFNAFDERFKPGITGFEHVSTVGKNIEIKKVKVTYALLPVWILSAKYKKRRYSFVLNGQTGKFVGELPVSSAKFALYVLLVFAVLSLVLYGVINVFFMGG
ncbi:MAG: hypothetical protein LBT59_20955 [Clostridiales bacterium]|nr:hypothetical protein [Clostridiales bacterium]